MSGGPAPTDRPAREVDDVVAFLVDAVCDLVGCAPDEVVPAAPLEDLALDSLEAVIITGDLSAWLGWEVDETLPWRVQTLVELAEVVAAEDRDRQRPS